METQTLGFAHFLTNADGIAKFILIVMLIMSIATWYFIIAKSLQNFLLKRKSASFLKTFWEARDLNHVAQQVRAGGGEEPFSRVVAEGITACEHYRRPGAQRLIDAGSADDFLTRSIRRSIERDTTKLESGLSVLASVGSSAPFIGLFGTVWGIYHALVAIGMQGQGTLDKVAGPVGEALIMTAIGLAVAIPAVLAYNFFQRSNRKLLAELDSFAHDVFAFLSTGNVGDKNYTPSVSHDGAIPLTQPSMRAKGVA
jgi:biopolymer transport protein ExbB